MIIIEENIIIHPHLPHQEVPPIPALVKNIKLKEKFRKVKEEIQCINLNNNKKKGIIMTNLRKVLLRANLTL